MERRQNGKDVPEKDERKGEETQEGVIKEDEREMEIRAPSEMS